MKIQLTEQEITDAIRQYILREIGSEVVQKIEIFCRFDNETQRLYIEGAYVDVE